MRSQLQLLGLLAPILAIAAETTPRVVRPSLLKVESDLKCYSDEVPCENTCMLPGDNCCNDGTDSYCVMGTYCTTTACCMEGATCDEPPLDPSYTNTAGGFGGFFPTATSSSPSNPSTFSFSFENFGGASTTASGAQSTASSSETRSAAVTSSSAAGSDNTSSTPASAAQTPAPTNGAGHHSADVKKAAALVAAAAGLLM